MNLYKKQTDLHTILIPCRDYKYTYIATQETSAKRKVIRRIPYEENSTYAVSDNTR